MSAPSPRDDSQPPEPHGGPLGLRTRKRAYFIMMGVCLLLIGLASTSGWAAATAQRTRALLIAEPEEGNVHGRDSAPVR